MTWMFMIQPGETHADYLPRLREHNKAFRESGMEALRELQARQLASRDRLRAALATIPDPVERQFAMENAL